MTLIDLTGQRFGRLTVISRAEDRVYPSGKHGTAYFCRCDCGVGKIIPTTALRQGRSRSCGCLQEQVRSDVHKKHGNCDHRLYNIWTNMKQRCRNRKNPDFKNYGGRGIKVCEEWLGSFKAFYAWALANGYRENLSIDRIDVNGNYEPSNCRWATALEQRHNRRDTKGSGTDE